MRTDFHGWQRKLGVLTLLLACIFAAGWVRSQTVDDILVTYRPHFYFNVFSDQFGIWLDYQYRDPNSLSYMATATSEPAWSYRPRPVNWAQGIDPDYEFDQDFEWSFGGFYFASANSPRDRSKLEAVTLIVPYWSIVIPLTLLSAALLRCGPRAAKAI